MRLLLERARLWRAGRFPVLRRVSGFRIFALMTIVALAPANAAFAQTAGLRSGEAFVTRFSGITSVPGPGGPQLMLDPQGVVGSILDLRAPGRPPEGQHWVNEPQRAPLRAQEVGQIFGVALDDATPPN